ncbi:tRNA lysidine(34) synthetase TilS [Mixta theicola]|uniref:tRNA(Ile)-lysidine synthase n=1 Tax=Mixta theicola TaxID=1458355 RepID=A0A2K1Q9F8_9GAMM|nr:tRNA lysidine(34) synthetase TilS [Mixta theicola]PNS11676.1 tRNA lysidine(34) synthetase TilS [Mixta theicola]GLR08771.1 tRNA(Ile)-lysidine synthase [Mixta theicola]
MTQLAQLEQQLADEQRLLVAFSGGLDSTVLLHQLILLRQRRPELQLRAIHIHHGLSPYADSWAQHCRSVCEAWQVELDVVAIRVDGSDSGIEGAAREGRYQAFRDRLRSGEALVTAQHLDDQCETLLLALKRGSGPAGLAAMPVSLATGEHRLLRPLLSCQRAELESWADKYQLRWVEDESNQDIRYDRNFLRQRILPVLNERWPHFAAAVARSAALCGEQEQLLDELLAESLATRVQADGALRIDGFAALSEARRAALLRRWIAGCGGKMPSRDAINRLWQEVIDAREDAAPRLQLGNHEIRRYRQALYWLPLRPSVRALMLPWPDPTRPLCLPYELGTLQLTESGTEIRPPRSDETVTVRFQAQGRFAIEGRSGHRPIKKLWQECGVPPWRRESTPLIFYNETLIAALNTFVCREGSAVAGKAWRIAWHR